MEELFYQIGQDICLSQCACGEVADHYIEFEILLVFIDMQLFGRKVYRHILFNRFSRTLQMEAWRFLLLCLFLDTYTQWVSLRGSAPGARISDWFHREHTDWAVLIVTLLETTWYFLCVSFTALLLSPKGLVWSLRAHLRIWEAIMISSFGKVFQLITLVWGGFAGIDQAMSLALGLFVAASNIIAVQTVLEDSDSKRAACAVALGSTLRVAIGYYYMMS